MRLQRINRHRRSRGIAKCCGRKEVGEEPGQIALAISAFVKKYGVEYTYLIAGAPSDTWEKVPQLVNLNTWPATIFIGRDGRVKAVHSGFASPASGEFHSDLEKEFTARIEQLLVEKQGENVAAATAPLSKPGE